MCEQSARCVIIMRSPSPIIIGLHKGGITISRVPTVTATISYSIERKDYGQDWWSRGFVVLLHISLWSVATSSPTLVEQEKYWNQVVRNTLSCFSILVVGLWAGFVVTLVSKSSKLKLLLLSYNIFYNAPDDKIFSFLCGSLGGVHANWTWYRISAMHSSKQVCSR